MPGYVQGCCVWWGSPCGVNYNVDLTQKYNSCVTLGGGLIHLMSTVYYETH